MFKKIFFGGVIVVVLGLAVAYFVRNSLVAAAIEEGSMRTLGVEVELGSASLGVTAASLGLSDYAIRNPEGFEAENLIAIDHGHLDIDAGSVFDNEIVVDSLVLAGINVNLLQVDAGNNAGAVMRNIKTNVGESSGQSDKKLMIKYLALRDISVSAALTIAGKQQYEGSYSLENFTLENVGGSDGATIGEVAGRVVRAVLTRAATQGDLPGQLSENLEGLGRSKIEEVKSEVTDKIKGVGKDLLGGDDE